MSPNWINVWRKSTALTNDERGKGNNGKSSKKLSKKRGGQGPLHAIVRLSEARRIRTHNCLQSSQIFEFLRLFQQQSLLLIHQGDQVMLLP